MTSIGFKRSRSPPHTSPTLHTDPTLVSSPSCSPALPLAGDTCSLLSRAEGFPVCESPSPIATGTSPASLFVSSSSTTPRPNTAPRSNMESWDSLDTPPSEIALLQRKEDSLADMLLFLAKTLSQLGSPSALQSLVEHALSGGGCRRCLFALRQCGMETAFFDHLFHSTMRKATDCRLLLLVVWKFLTESDRAIGGGVKAATFLLSFCTPVKVPPTSNTACSLSSSSLIGPRTSKDAEEATLKKSLSSHWSTPRRKSQTVGGTAINPVTPERTALQAAVENFCGETLPVREMGEKNQHDYPPLRAASTERDESVTISENCSVALQVLMDLLMRQNQSDSSRLDRLETSILEADGLEVLAQLVTLAASLGEVTVLSHQVFSLLEVITVGPSVKMYTTQLSHCVDTVSALLPIKENPMVTAEVQLPPAKQEQERCSVSQRPILRTVDDELRVLRVLTNLTALDPYPGSEEATKRIGLYVRSVLLHPLPPEEDAERLTFVLCCAINAAKLECFYRQVPGKHTNTPFVSSLLPKDMESACVLKAMMRHLFLCYRSHTTEYLVIAGYYALLIGILSLVKYENKDLRVSIITVIAQTEKKDVAESTDQPMAIIVAIIQEFLLFQSNASALCETAFIEINEIVDHILIANKISLPET